MQKERTSWHCLSPWELSQPVPPCQLGGKVTATSSQLHKPTPPPGSRKAYLGFSLLKEKKWFPFRSHSQYLVPCIGPGLIMCPSVFPVARENTWVDWSQSEPNSGKVSLSLKYISWECASRVCGPTNGALENLQKRHCSPPIKNHVTLVTSKQGTRCLALWGRKKMCTLWSLLFKNLHVRWIVPSRISSSSALQRLYFLRSTLLELIRATVTNKPHLSEVYLLCTLLSSAVWPVDEQHSAVSARWWRGKESGEDGCFSTAWLWAN